jgi:fructokinase
MGHLGVRRDARDTEFAGLCPFHGDCLEGLASGPAIRARWGCDLASLPADHAGRSIVAGYIGQLAAAIALLHAPQSLVIGGGVMSDGTLLPLVRQSTASHLGGYLAYLRDPDSMGAFIRAPGLGSDSAIAGAMLMARAALPQMGTRRRQVQPARPDR